MTENSTHAEKLKEDVLRCVFGPANEHVPDNWQNALVPCADGNKLFVDTENTGGYACFHHEVKSFCSFPRANGDEWNRPENLLFYAKQGGGKKPPNARRFLRTLFPEEGHDFYPADDLDSLMEHTRYICRDILFDDVEQGTESIDSVWVFAYDIPGRETIRDDDMHTAKYRMVAALQLQGSYHSVFMDIPKVVRFHYIQGLPTDQSSMCEIIHTLLLPSNKEAAKRALIYKDEDRCENEEFVRELVQLAASTAGHLLASKEQEQLLLDLGDAYVAKQNLMDVLTRTYVQPFSTAFCMSAHGRLGAGSLFGQMPNEVLQMIWRAAEPGITYQECGDY